MAFRVYRAGVVGLIGLWGLWFKSSRLGGERVQGSREELGCDGSAPGYQKTAQGLEEQERHAATSMPKPKPKP